MVNKDFQKEELYFFHIFDKSKQYFDRLLPNKRVSK